MELSFLDRMIYTRSIQRKRFDGRESFDEDIINSVLLITITSNAKDYIYSQGTLSNFYLAYRRYSGSLIPFIRGSLYKI